MESSEVMLREHAAGVPLRAIAARHGVGSHETVRTAIRRAQRAHLQEMSGRLLLARRSGEMITFESSPDGDEFVMATGYIRWLVNELRELSIRVRVHTWERDGRLVFGLQELPTREGGK